MMPLVRRAYVSLLLLVPFLACGGSTEPSLDLSGDWSYSAQLSDATRDCQFTGYTLSVGSAAVQIEGGTIACDGCSASIDMGSGNFQQDGSEVAFATDVLDHEGTASPTRMSGTVVVDRIEFGCVDRVEILDGVSGTWEATR